MTSRPRVAGALGPSGAVIAMEVDQATDAVVVLASSTSSTVAPRQFWASPAAEVVGFQPALTGDRALECPGDMRRAVCRRLCVRAALSAG